VTEIEGKNIFVLQQITGSDIFLALVVDQKKPWLRLVRFYGCQ